MIERWAILGVMTIAAGVALWFTGSLHPRDLEKRRRDVSMYPALTWLLAGVAVFMTLMIGTTAAAAAMRIPSTASESTTARAALVGYALAIGVGVWLMHVFTRGAHRAGLRVHWKDPIFGLAWLALAAGPIMLTTRAAVFAYEAISGTSADTLAHPSLRELAEGGPGAWLIVASAVIGAPIVEEITYRIFLQSSILRLTNSPWTAVLITSVLFTFMHWPAVPVYGLATLFVLSVAMGLAYERTGRAGVPIVMHMAFNAANIALAMRGV